MPIKKIKRKLVNVTVTVTESFVVGVGFTVGIRLCEQAFTAKQLVKITVKVTYTLCR